MYGYPARARAHSRGTSALFNAGRVLRGLWQASRPHNAATAAASTTLGTWLAYASVRHGVTSYGGAEVRWSLGAPLCALLAVAAANLYNDACDLAADRVNAPHRPLPQGIITRRQAVWAAACCATLAGLCATQLQSSARSLAFVAIVAGLVYSPVLKSTVLVGNAWVAVLSAVTIAVGALQVGPLTPVVWMALVSLTLFVLAREILKCMADRVGDAQAQLTSVATRFGERGASRIMLAVSGLCGLSLAAPLFMGNDQPQSARLFAVLAVAGGVLPLMTAWYLSAGMDPRPHPAPRYKTALRLTKAGGLMLLGAFGLLVA